MKNSIQRISFQSEICHIKPCIRSMHWPVKVLLDMPGSGITIQEKLQDSPKLEKEDSLT